MKKPQFRLLTIVILLVCSVSAFGQRYEKPPKEIMDILNAPAIPATSVSPARNKVALLEPVRYPPIADLAEPMYRLAGLRINPKTNSSYNERYYLSLKLKNISDGKETAVNLPGGVKLISPKWSADGKYLAAGNITPNGVELWVVETANGKATKLKGVQVNTAFGGFNWMPDQRSLMVNLVPANRGTAPSVSGVPTSPSIQETAGNAAAIPTYQDLLKSPTDEKLFDYYTTSQLAIVGIDGKIKQLGKPAIFDTVEVSPSGQYVLVSRITRPYTYLFPFWSFPNEVEVWDTDRGPLVYKVASVPIRDNLPNGGVTTSPRSIDWIPTEPATLMWVEALDGGDPKNKVDYRDKLMVYKVPTKMFPKEILKTQQRYSGRLFGEKDGMMWYYDYDRDKQRRRIFMTDYLEGRESKLISDLNVRDRYNDIGSPETKILPNGKRVIIQNGTSVYLSGSGATPQGDRPFLHKMDLGTLKKEELFRSGENEYETFVDLMDDNANAFITRRESENEPPNLFLRDRTNTPEARANATSLKPITNFKDPTPQLKGISKKLIKYKRKDGVDLSFTLYLPPNYKEGTKLPTLLWAYPLEYTNNAVAGQVSGSTNRFTQIGGYSHLFLLLEGYAILQDATVPIVGDPLTVNDTFIQQLVDGAQAAIDKGVELGVVDRDRVAVGGHSYGAFMTAHLLANSDMFRAGIARSGAYNRTLTPFGFQSERRTFWEAPESYYTLSPFMRANKINEPMLMIHGQADNNSGTYPIQSERMFAAIQGNGGTARLVMLPLESHGYSARESIEHVLWEQINWMDKYVKNAKPR
ncbi:MAG: S9 family peptidase [Acidobacteria bacterium]|nr:S9 family peptidase [Acidobacteriota bacterium]